MEQTSRFTWDKLMKSTPAVRKHFSITRKADTRERTSASSQLTEAGDERTQFMKDFDNTCNSSFVRRLHDKAQVFPLESGDAARTRLTHSLEVMSLAESMGSKVTEEVSKLELSYLKSLGLSAEEIEKQLSCLKDISIVLKTAALLHDLGNPPFGHISEGVISEWFRSNLPCLWVNEDGKLYDHQTTAKCYRLSDLLSDEQKRDLTNFDGNAQVVRILSSLQSEPTPSLPIFATIIKYPFNEITDANWKGEVAKNEEFVKKGFFWSEQDVYNNIQLRLGLHNRRHPLAFLLEACDYISYLLSDVEDAVRRGLMNCEMIMAALSASKKAAPISKADKAFNDANKEFIKEAIYVLDYCQKHEDHESLRLFRIFMRGKMLCKVVDAFTSNYNDIMNGIFNKELLNSSNASLFTNVFRSLLKEHVYYCPTIIVSKVKSCEIISSLVKAFLFACFNKNVDVMEDDAVTLLYNLVSPTFRKQAIHEVTYRINELSGNRVNKEKEELQIRAYYNTRLAIDYISGMTDSYALKVYGIIKAIH